MSFIEKVPWQGWSILGIWLGLFPLMIGLTLASSENFAEVFFFADVSVAKEIISTGHIQSPGLDSTFWRKATSRTRQPILPIYLSLGTLITDLPLSVFQRQLPLYPILIGCYYLIMQEFAEPKVSSLLAVVGPIAPNFTAVTAYVMGPMFLIPFLLIIWILIRRAKQTQSGHLLSVICLPILFLNLIYSYPRLFALAALVSVASVLIHWWITRDTMIAPLTGAFLGFWILLTQGFAAYEQAIIGVAGNLVSDPFSIISFAGGSGGPVSPLDVPPVSLITIPILLPLGIAGAIIVIRRVANLRLSTSQKHHGEPILFAWGVALIGFALLHILIGKFWLVLRLYGTAVPLLLVTSAMVISLLRDNQVTRYNTQSIGQLGLVAVIAIMLISFSWAAIAPNTDVHTYQDDSAEAAKWTSHANGPVLSDMSLGSHIVLQQRAVYPHTPEGVTQFFYSDPHTRKWPSSSPDASLVMLSEEWVTTGFYIPPSSREPVDRSWFESTRQSGMVVYSSGRISILAVEKGEDRKSSQLTE